MVQVRASFRLLAGAAALGDSLTRAGTPENKREFLPIKLGTIYVYKGDTLGGLYQPTGGM